MSLDTIQSNDGFLPQTNLSLNLSFDGTFIRERILRIVGHRRRWAGRGRHSFRFNPHCRKWHSVLQWTRGNPQYSTIGAELRATKQCTYQNLTLFYQELLRTNKTLNKTVHTILDIERKKQTSTTGVWMMGSTLSIHDDVVEDMRWAGWFVATTEGIDEAVIDSDDDGAGERYKNWQK